MASHRLFVYGTLKRGQPNEKQFGPEYGVARYVGQAQTVKKWPLVIASSCNIPYLLDREGIGHVRIRWGIIEWITMIGATRVVKTMIHSMRGVLWSRPCQASKYLKCYRTGSPVPNAVFPVLSQHQYKYNAKT